MRNDAYQAKLWLNRNYHFTRQIEADRRSLEKLLNGLGSGVAKYENDGSSNRDSDAARAKHEDQLGDYSMMKQKVEEEEKKYLRETAKTKSAIDELQDPDQHAVAVYRYIDLMRWEDIAKAVHISRPHVFRIHNKMLEKMAEILRSGKYV